MTSLVFRSASVLSLTLAVACTEDTVPIDTEGSMTTAGDSTTAATNPTTTGVTTVASTGDASADGTTTTTAGSSSSGGEATTSDTTSAEGCVAVCGNNQVECVGEPEEEVCDLAQLGGETCVSLGFQGGQLGCLLTCDDYNLLGCFICGNEVVDIAEDCEGSVPEGVTCESMGFEGGEIVCGDDCLFDMSDCSICGDGVRQGPEDCDGLDFGGETCMSIGFDGGNLACSLASCGFVYTGCFGGQYLQDFEGGPPLPIEFTTGGAANWVVDMGNPINGSYSAWSTDLGEGQNNFMSISATFAAAGDISFVHEESSEATFDFLEFYIDGVLVDSWSGINPPMMETYPVAAGVHDFEWRYDKDGVVSVGADSVWVDDITLVPGVPI